MVVERERESPQLRTVHACYTGVHIPAGSHFLLVPAGIGVPSRSLAPDEPQCACVKDVNSNIKLKIELPRTDVFRVLTAAEVGAGAVVVAHSPAAIPHRRNKGKATVVVTRAGVSSSSSLPDLESEKTASLPAAAFLTPTSSTSSSSSTSTTTTTTYTKSQVAVLIVLFTSTLSSAFAVCLFPPFFPQIAESKGAPVSVYGFIIGTNCLTSFFVTPIFGKHLNKIGLRFAFVAGLFMSGGCCFLSGFLEFFPPGLEFVLESIAIRIVHASANALVIVSTFAYGATEFPQSVASIFSVTRAMMNVGQLLGPVVGGALYEAGGFKMPFLVMGVVQMCMALPARLLLPNYEEDGEDEKEPTSIFSILSIPTIWIALCNIISSTMSNGFLSIMLEPQILRQAPRHNKLVIFLAAGLGAASFAFLGPVPGIPIKETLTVAIVALSLNGIAISGQQVAGMADATYEATTAGHVDPHGIVSGVWSSMCGGGRFISRCFAGLVVESIGFREATCIIVLLQVTVPPSQPPMWRLCKRGCANAAAVRAAVDENGRITFEDLEETLGIDAWLISRILKLNYNNKKSAGRTPHLLGGEQNSAWAVVALGFATARCRGYDDSCKDQASKPLLRRRRGKTIDVVSTTTPSEPLMPKAFLAVRARRRPSSFSKSFDFAASYET
ncbi:unnamed protein product [Notodromas monacha]|uniref:Major facilitator superfamily (MFS) profile domain-containing protein n=1 Tax=Notodromas monacha TaxID=399045 RepID=A0A7R9G9H9_9CRUS|nr:unnamed protein product [Notodromas monacha]CAG0914227.1 unnamed protein product [Notodromas monacha]